MKYRIREHSALWWIVFLGQAALYGLPVIAITTTVHMILICL